MSEVTRILAIDIGRCGVKSVGENRMDSFPSVVGDSRELKSDVRLGDRDIIMDYENQMYFGGELALRESEFPIQDSRSSKIHEYTKILGIMAMHRTVQDGDSVLLIIGHPIDDHTPANKAKMKQLFIGNHSATINGIKRTWEVVDVIVATEGAVAVWGVRKLPQTVHVIDAGSRKTNYATMVNKGLYDRLSGTLDFGCETIKNMHPTHFAELIASNLSRRWLNILGPVILVGGMAEQLEEPLRNHYKNVIVPPNPRFATAVGMYEIGVKLCAKTAVSGQ